MFYLSTVKHKLSIECYIASVIFKHSVQLHERDSDIHAAAINTFYHTANLNYVSEISIKEVGKLRDSKYKLKYSWIN